MTQTYVEVENIKIAYIEKNKEAAYTIFFIHGNSISKRSWRKQYSSDILSAYRMVAIDLPSHGDSDAAEVYNLPVLAALMAKAVKLLADGKPYILAGISLSTNIIAEMFAYDMNPEGLVLAGPCIIGENVGVEKWLKPNTHVGVVFTDSADMNDVIAYAKETSLSEDENDLRIFLEDYNKVKPPFRSSLARSVAEAIYNDEIVLLQQSNCPILIIFGRDEKVVDPDYLDHTEFNLWRSQVFKIAGASHLVNIDQPELFNQLLKSFADDMFK